MKVSLAPISSQNICTFNANHNYGLGRDVRKQANGIFPISHHLLEYLVVWSVDYVHMYTYSTRSGDLKFIEFLALSMSIFKMAKDY